MSRASKLIAQANLILKGDMTINKKDWLEEVDEILQEKDLDSSQRSILLDRRQAVLLLVKVLAS